VLGPSPTLDSMIAQEKRHAVETMREIDRDRGSRHLSP
jgi:hypothetical protein